MLWTISIVFTNFVALSLARTKRFVFAAGSLPVASWLGMPPKCRTFVFRILRKHPDSSNRGVTDPILCPAQIRYERIGALLAPRETPQSGLLLSPYCFRRELCRRANRRCYDKSQGPSPILDSS